ncbi:MAG: DNA-protecting protein DprA [Gammaproteobacteria bacterium]|nr:DNA-protecting protein DprA [Gammaproteobacteria bacterium]
MVAAPQYQITAETLTDWLTLYHTPGVGSVTFHQLLDVIPNLEGLQDVGSGVLGRLGLQQASIKALQHPEQAAIMRDLEWHDEPGNRILCCNEPDYPLLLSQLPDPPPLLYVHGNVQVLNEPQLAMVGSRNPTASGQQTARDFARHLSAAGLGITSGLALGIDASSHQGALDAGGSTIAVMGTGLDRVYPARHRDLAREISVRGALVSEFPVGTPPRAENFPRRNRIISGLSLGTLVIEAALRSGSLISARCAGEQGREVFAIPGSIHNPLARGCHHLIRQGAKLVETAQDVIDELGPLAGACAEPGQHLSADGTAKQPQLDVEYTQLLDYIGFDSASVDQLVTTSGLTPAEVSSMLLQLEMQGFIASSPGGLYNRLK